MKKFRLISILLALSMVLSACGGLRVKDDIEAAEVHQVQAQGYGGPIKMEVAFEDGRIIDIKITEENETDGIGTPALDQIPQAIVENQSLAIDALTGATITSFAILDGVKEAIVEAGLDLEAFENAQVEVKFGQEVNEETDVVVVGGGGAGLSAAVSAARDGARVILVEKTGALGGNTIRAGGPYNAVDPARQKSLPAADQASMERILDLTKKEAMNPRHQALMDELRADIEEYEAGNKDQLFDSLALHKLQTYDGGDYKGDLEFIEKMVDQALPTAEWMEGNGLVWTDDISTVPGGLWPRAHLPLNSAGKDYIDSGERTARDLGVQILLNSPVEDLIVEDGAVVGVRGKSQNAPMEIRSKLVILATGGFAANKEMRQEYDPNLLESLPTTNSPAISGDGISMAKKIGANLVGMEYIQSLPLGSPIDGGLNGWMGAAGVEYYYQVNKSGQRFMAEDGRRDTMTQALLAQEDGMSYVITGGNNKVEVGTEDGLNLWGDKVEDLVEKGIIFRADTIEELAEQIGIDPEVLKETNDKFNSYVERGEDPDFGRSLFGQPIVAPFYASMRVPTVHHTMGGLQIDLKNHVLDQDGNWIEGLLAAGEVTGGIHGANRLGGNALVDIHVFGRSAGQEAARLIKE